ncbi:MAG: Ig-like domain repeat protein, partial [Planctomycetota bacterium]
LVSSEGTLSVTAAGGAKVQYSSDGGQRWSDAFAAREGRNDVLVRQVDALGRASSKTAFTFTLDTRAPATPKLTIAGGGYVTPTNPLVRRADVAFTGVEGGARLEYSAAGGAWTPSWTPVEGQNSVRVRQVDAAGNASRPSRPLTFELKTRIDAPTVALVRDTGWSSLDRVTSDPRLRLGGVDTGAVPWYSVDGGRSWKRAFAAVEGRNAVLVRQVDTLGNVSASTRFEFTLDRAAPGRPVVWASLSEVGRPTGQVRVDRVEDGARVEYSADGRTWDEAMPVTPARGGYRVFVRAVDRAGNVSRAASVALSRRI